MHCGVKAEITCYSLESERYLLFFLAVVNVQIIAAFLQLFCNNNAEHVRQDITRVIIIHVPPCMSKANDMG